MMLSELEVGERALLADFSVSRLHQRLLSMGISPGTPTMIVRKLPVQGNMYVRFGERNVVLRFAEAQDIHVKQF